jgi:hypothetical protein
MKTYKQLMEVMSIDDMNQITGGTDAQRKIAQDRQRRREAKAKGFDPNKEVLKDKPKDPTPPPAPATTPTNNTPKPNNTSTAIVKSPTPAPKQEPERKPDFRKSQIGKWSQGIKNSPDKLTKKGGELVKVEPKNKGSEIVKAKQNKPVLRKPPVEKVKVKVDEPKKRNDMEGQSAARPGTTKPEQQPNPITQEQERKKRKKLKLGKHLKNLGSGAAGLAKKAFNSAGSAPVETYTGAQQTGLQQRGNQVSS